MCCITIDEIACIKAIGQDLISQADDYSESAKRMWEGIAGDAKEAAREVEQFGGAVQVIDNTKIVDLKAVPDIASLANADQAIKEVAPDQKTFKILPKVDPVFVSKARQELDENLLKKLKIEADIDIASALLPKNWTTRYVRILRK